MNEVISVKQQRVDSITPEMLRRLTDFAYCRLIANELPTSFAEDLPQVAVHSLLNNNRNPRPEDLATDEAFENYLRGIISSKAEAMRHRTKFEPLPEFEKPELHKDLAISTDDPASNVAEAELKAILFRELRKWASPRHLPTIAEWEKVYDHSDRIPAIKGRRKYVFEIRHQAQKILLDFGFVKTNHATRSNS